MPYKYENTTFIILQAMSANGALPNLLVYYPFPICAACIYGKSIKCSRKTKTERFMNEYKPVASVGYCVYIDVLASITPGLVMQMSIFLTLQRYQYAFVFVYHRSKVSNLR